MKIDKICDEKVLEKASFEKWRTIGNINAVGKVGATIVGATADAAIDGLSGVNKLLRASARAL